MTSGWEDPFAEEEAARERERRRAEREARRRERDGGRSEAQTALGDRVRDFLQRPMHAQADDGDGRPPSQEHPRPVPPERPARKAPPSRSEPPRPRPGEVQRRRRVLAVVGLLAALGVIAVVVAAIDNGSGGGTPTAAVPAGPVHEVTIPEGEDRSQIADTAKQAGITGDYMKASRAYKGFDPSKYGAPQGATLEGFLFPATYELPRHPTADDLVVRQLAAFKQYLSQVNMSYARSKNLTTFDVLTIASMIEREVQVDKERKLVAAVIYNRLRAGMPLQIDATIRYATGNFTEPLSESDLQSSSPYNTYTNQGLPPGPIGNPGLASIQAAAHPANVPYLYYVVKPGTCPAQHAFATTDAQFERDKAAYDQARAAAGNQSPTC